MWIVAIHIKPAADNDKRVAIASTASRDDNHVIPSQLDI